MHLLLLFLLPLLVHGDPPTTPVTPAVDCIKPGTCYGLPTDCQPDTDHNCRLWIDFNDEEGKVSVHINSEIDEETYFALTADIPSVETKEFLICVPRGGRRLRGKAVDGEAVTIVDKLTSDPDAIQTYFDRNFICTFNKDELPENFLTRSNFFISEGQFADLMVIPQPTELLPVGLDMWTNGHEDGLVEEEHEPLDPVEHDDTEHQESPRIERGLLDEKKWDCSQQGTCFGLPANCQPESTGNDCRLWIDLNEQHVNVHINSEIHEEDYFAVTTDDGKEKEYLICVPRAEKRLRGEAVDGEPVRIVDRLKSRPDAVQTYFNRNFICTFNETELPKDFTKKSNKFFITEGRLVNDLTIPPGIELSVVNSDIWKQRHSGRVRAARNITTETQIEKPTEEVERQKRGIPEENPHHSIQSEDIKEDEEVKKEEENTQKSRRDETKIDDLEDSSDENHSISFSPYIYPIALVILFRFLRNGN